MMVKEIVKEISDLCLMQKARNIEFKIFSEEDEEATLTDMYKIFKGTCFACGEKGHKKGKCPHTTS